MLAAGAPRSLLTNGISVTVSFRCLKLETRSKYILIWFRSKMQRYYERVNVTLSKQRSSA